MTKAIRELERRLPPGWEVAGFAGSGHIKLIKSGRSAVYTAATPKDRNAFRKVVADVKRADRRGG